VADQDTATPKYERLAVDGDGDAWGYRDGKWDCISDSAAADDDADLERQYPPVTFYLPPVPLGRGQLGTALAALEDAAAFRREYQDGDCADCDALPEGALCGDHDCDEAMASMYDLLHEELQEHQEAAPAPLDRKRLRCVWCGTGLAAIDAAPIQHARNPGVSDEENMQCADRDACQARQDEADADTAAGEGNQ
jgi:hypothetical protein